MAGMHKPKKGHRYSYSGADAKVWMYRGNNISGFIESLQTISFSIHEPRGRVRSLGYRGVKGFTRSIREIAGTMIFTVIEDHPLSHLLNSPSPGFSIDAHTSGVGNLLGVDTTSSNRRIATNIKPFNMTMVYATEMLSSTSLGIDASDKWKSAHTFDREKDGSSSKHASGTWDTEGNFIEDIEGSHAHYPFTPEPMGMANVVDEFKMDGTIKKKNKFNVAGLSLIDIEIITEGIVTSVNDMITEVQVQFLAKDYKEFSLGHHELESKDISQSEALEFAKAFYQQSSQYQQWEEGLKEWEKEMETKMRNTWGTMESRNLSDLQALYPGAKIEINPKTGYPMPPTMTTLNQEGFSYDPATGTFVSSVVVINNPIEFIVDPLDD